MASGDVSNRTVTTRPRGRDPGLARRRILEAAVGEFAARGFAGARVDRIARAAGLNKRMLYHYFGDKRGLHDAVLASLWRSAATGRLDAAGARLLLWALLEPATADAARVELARAGSPAAAAARDHSELALALLDGLLPRAAGRGHKPRVRLKRGERGR